MTTFRQETASELHQRLRQASKQAHHQLDHHPLLAPLVTAQLTEVQYGNALAALYGVQALAEQQIHDFLDRHDVYAAYRPPRRLAALQADLSVLNRAPAAAVMHFAPPDRVATLIGMLYTHQGANMGGQVIARTLHRFGHGHLPMRFFAGEGDTSEQDWAQFWVFAHQHCPVPDYDSAAANALAFFDAIGEHLDRVHQELLLVPGAAGGSSAGIAP